MSYACWIGAGLASLLLTGSTTIAQLPSVEWVRQFGGADRDNIWSTVTDDSAIYVAGYTFDALPGQTHAGGWDAFVRKYDLDGNVLWTDQFGSEFFDVVFGLARHGNGLYVVGAADGNIPEGVFLRRYDLDGQEIWTEYFGPGTQHSTRGTAVSADASGVYVVGFTNGAFPGFTNAGAEDTFIKKFDFDGNLIWTRQLGTSTHDHSWLVSAQETAVYVTGYTLGTWPGETNVGSWDGFVHKYDTDGNLLWARHVGSSASDVPGGLAVSAEAVYVGGTTEGAFPGQTSAGLEDAFLRKLDLDGNTVWTRQFGSESRDFVPTASAGGSAVAVDASGVYITGNTGRELGQELFGNVDVFVRKYDGTGDEQWTLQLGTVDSEVPAAISAHATGLYLGGHIFGEFPGHTLAGPSDAYVLKIATNQPPEAICTDRTVSAGIGCDADADVDAGSFDPEGGVVTLQQDPPGPYGLGSTQVTLTVGDPSGASASCTATVTVVDDIPPELAVGLSPATLWPPNHHMIPVTATVIAEDACSTPSVTLISVSSNEPDNGNGDGDTTNDIQGAELGTADFALLLRAERSGTGSGRIYTIVYSADDGSGNETHQAGFVVVPHDQGGTVEPIMVSVEQNPLGAWAWWPPVAELDSYDVIRGRVDAITATETVIELGPLVCIERGSTDAQTLGDEDGALPSPGVAFFYLVEYDDGVSSSYGTESAGKPRVAGAGGCQTP